MFIFPFCSNKFCFMYFESLLLGACIFRVVCLLKFTPLSYIIFLFISVVFLLLQSTLSEINIPTTPFFWLGFAWYIHLLWIYAFIFKVGLLSTVHFLNPSRQSDFLVQLFTSFMFNVIIDVNLLSYFLFNPSALWSLFFSSFFLDLLFTTHIYFASLKSYTSFSVIYIMHL